MSKPVSRMITLQAITFLHPGTGQTTGVVDLPIQREVHTGFPMFAASGFKGSLRDKAERLWGKKDPKITTLFGGSDAQPSAGALSLTDARILAFPVRSLQGVFVWATCPMILKRLQRDTRLIGMTEPDWKTAAIQGEKETVLVLSGSGFTDPLVLEEIQFKIKDLAGDTNVQSSIQKILHKDAEFDPARLVIVPDEDFTYMVNHATQIATRIKLNDQKTTTGGDGNMWVEETLPPETILYGLAVCHAPRMNGQVGGADHVAQHLEALANDNYLQIGGNETVGQGWCCIKVNGGV
ncbi:MAG: type III-B CRISPR module RAMP protein Cmr4 [Desulfobulbus sp.]|nr:type III-B CRISPR module RAMP protein Cmr4 [Desulfobulbus sp.]